MKAEAKDFEMKSCSHMGSSQNQDPVLVPLNIRRRDIIH